MIYLLHSANVVYVFSYLVKDILWLRVLTVLGGVLLLTFYLLQPMPLWQAAGWGVIFLSINLWQVQVLLLERRPVRLAPDALRLYQCAFRTLSPREFSKLLDVAEWKSADDGQTIVRQGHELDRMMVIADGRAQVIVDGRPVTELKPGQFVGERSYLTGERPNADVVAAGTVRFVCWPRDQLRATLSRNADLRAAVQMVIGVDLAAKLSPAVKA